MFVRQSRRTFLAGLTVAPLAAALCQSATAAEVSWLDEVTTLPESSLPDGETFAPLLERADGSPITTREQWETARLALRQRWLEFLGPMPAERPPVALETLKTDETDGVTRRLVRYLSESDQPVEGYLLIPPEAKTGPRPGVVLLHPTNAATIDEVAGFAGEPPRHTALRLARRGFVVFAPRCFLWQNAPSLQEAVAGFQKRHPGTKGMHKMLWDAQRGVDVLASLSEIVDPQRIGASGHSLGAKEALYLAAFDDRIRAAVASEGGIGFSFTNWDAPWYLGETIKSPEFSLNHHQLLALIAPRPFLILGGESGRGAADGKRSAAYLKAALPAWKLYAGRPRLGLYNHGEGHTVSDKTFERWAQWLETYLA